MSPQILLIGLAGEYIVPIGVWQGRHLVGEASVLVLDRQSCPGWRGRGRSLGCAREQALNGFEFFHDILIVVVKADGF